MDTQKFIGLLVLLATFAVSNGQENATCTRHLELTPHYNFSIEAIQGVWINWNTYYFRNEDVDTVPIRCAQATISELYENEPFDMNIVERYEDREGTTRQNHTYLWYPDPLVVPSPAIWRRFTLENDGVLVPSDSVYLLTDYTSWAIQYVCTVKDNRTVGTLMVWTRSSQPSAFLIDYLEDRVKYYGYSLTNRRNIDHSECI